MNVINIILVSICLLFFIVGVISLIHNYFVNTYGELRYMLRCAKKRYEILPSVENQNNVKKLKKKVENYWGKKFIRKKDVSMFDYLD